ncbi:MAG: hypothetical protein AAB706_00055 [Patescibacteria group bacterium]
MFNLLPNEEKKDIYTTYSIRRAILGLLFLFLAGIVMCVSLIPSFVLTKAKESEILQQIEFLNTSLALKNVNVLNQAIITARDDVKVLKDFASKSTSVFDLFNKILEKKSANIRLTGILFGAVSDKRQIVLNGIAKDREALLEFAQSIGREKAFSDISLPVSNFAKNKDIEFSFSVTGDF